MFFWWPIRYLSPITNKFETKNVYLDTLQLEPVTKCAIELSYEIGGTNKRTMLPFRSLFNAADQEPQTHLTGQKSFNSFIVIDYFEDDNGNDISGMPITINKDGALKTIQLPGIRPNAIQRSQPREVNASLSWSTINVSEKQLITLEYFTRDLKELKESAFMKEGPGTLASDNEGHKVKTAVTADDITAFIMTFRRMYMENEPANFLTACETYNQIHENKCSKWVSHYAKEYDYLLSSETEGINPNKKVAIPRKRLIDVFIYTQYAHQPNERRTKQFLECQESIGSDAHFVWLFLTAMWECSISIINGGSEIAAFYEYYCRHHNSEHDVISSVLKLAPGIGSLEKKGVRRARLFREKVEELAMILWQSSCRPVGGPARFFKDAEEQLLSKLDNTVFNLYSSQA